MLPLTRLNPTPTSTSKFWVLYVQCLYSPKRTSKLERKPRPLPQFYLPTLIFSPAQLSFFPGFFSLVGLSFKHQLQEDGHGPQYAKLPRTVRGFEAPTVCFQSLPVC